MSNLKFLRIEANLSQYELAAASGIPRWKIQLVEQGLAHFQPNEIEVLSSVLVPKARMQHQPEKSDKSEGQ